MKTKMYEQKDVFVDEEAGTVVTRLAGLRCPAKELVETGHLGIAVQMCPHVPMCRVLNQCCDKYMAVKGVAKCMEGDTFDLNTGKYISETKAQRKYRSKVMADYYRLADKLKVMMDVCVDKGDAHGDAYDDATRKINELIEGI